MFWNECMNPDTIKENYEKLEKILKCKLDVDELYHTAKEKAEEVRKVSNGKTFAVGQRLDYWPPKAACDLVKMGLEVKYVLVDAIRKSDLPYYEWLMQNYPQIRVYLAPDINMRKFIKNPEPVDIMIGTSATFLKHVEGLTDLKLSEEPYDFMTFIRVMEQMIEQLSAKEKPIVKTMETDIFAKRWIRYPKGVE